MHDLQRVAGGFFNTFCKVVSFFGKAGWGFILLACVFLLFSSMRRKGLGMGIALCIGALVTNILLKNIVDRARPYTHAPFDYWWLDAGQNTENSASFPSGHTTAAFASMVALFILSNKRRSWIGLLFACVMAFSRMYLIVHYPSDVLAGLLIGTGAGIAGAMLANLIYKKVGGKCKTLLYDWSIVPLCKKLFRKTAETSPTETGTESAPSEPAPNAPPRSDADTATDREENAGKDTTE